MCRYQTLYYQDGVGYIVRCAACNNFQLAYGNMVITLTAVDFKQLNVFVQKVRETHAIDIAQLQQPVAIPTPYEGIKLLLSGKDIDQMHEMLEGADTEWRSQQLLELFDRT